MLQKTRLKIERFLYKKGFTDAPLRDILLAQVVLLAVTLLLGLIMLLATSWFIYFFIGAALLSFNFWNMSLHVLKLQKGYSKTLVRDQLLRFAGRILLTGFVLAVAMLMGGSPVALGLGLLSCLVVISIVASVRFRGRN
jgi:hypothetical protein